MRKTERVFNLIALLLETRRALPAAEIRERIPGYDGQSDEAFHRMFDRDKAEVRELGFALDQEEDVWGVETRYRIRKEEALLSDPGLSADEVAALSLAAQMWGAGGGGLAVLKLSMGQVGEGPGPTGWVLPRVPMDRNVGMLIDAIERRKMVRFDYRTGGAGPVQRREVEPHGLYHRGVWYLTGFDRARGEIRHFRLSRVDGAVEVSGGREADFEHVERAMPMVPHGPWEGEIIAEAHVSFAPESAWWVERRTGARRISEREDGWIEFSIPVADVESFAGWVAGFGDGAVAISPVEIRSAVVARLRALAEA